jgi:hypothetical protein
MTDVDDVFSFVASGQARNCQFHVLFLQLLISIDVISASTAFNYVDAKYENAMCLELVKCLEQTDIVLGLAWGKLSRCVGRRQSCAH